MHNFRGNARLFVIIFELEAIFSSEFQRKTLIQEVSFLKRPFQRPKIPVNRKILLIKVNLKWSVYVFWNKEKNWRWIKYFKVSGFCSNQSFKYIFRAKFLEFLPLFCPSSCPQSYLSRFLLFSSWTNCLYWENFIKRKLLNSLRNLWFWRKYYWSSAFMKQLNLFTDDHVEKQVC